MNFILRTFLFSIFLGLFSFGQLLHAQILEPVKWSFHVVDAGDGMFDLVSEATIDETWHLYTQKEYEEGPLPTRFEFEKNASAELVGGVKESEFITHYEEIWEAEISYYENSAEFTQRVKRLNGQAITIKGFLEFMTCDDKTCLPPEYVDFEFIIPEAEEIDMEASFSDEHNGATLGEEPQIYDPVDWEFSIE